MVKWLLLSSHNGQIIRPKVKYFLCCVRFSITTRGWGVGVGGWGGYGIVVLTVIKKVRMVTNPLTTEAGESDH